MREFYVAEITTDEKTTIKFFLRMSIFVQETKSSKIKNVKVLEYRDDLTEDEQKALVQKWLPLAYK